MNMYRNRGGAGCGCCCCGGPAWAFFATRDEYVEDLEDYKRSLESEIIALEKRIKALKEKGEKNQGSEGQG